MNAADLLALLPYVEPARAAVLPPELRWEWTSTEGALPLARLLEQNEDEAVRAAMRAAARELEARALQLVRREVLPAGDLLAHTLALQTGALELHGARGAWKVRIDEELHLVALRRRPLPLPPPAAAGSEGVALARLRSALAEVLAIACEEPALAVVRSGTLGEPEEGAVWARLAPPSGLGLALGRYEAAVAYFDGRTLLVGFPVPAYSEACELPGPGEQPQAIELGPLEVPRAGEPGTGEPPRNRHDRDWLAADDARVAFNRRIAMQRAGGERGQVELVLTDTGEAQDEAIRLADWNAGRYDRVGG